MKIILSVAVFSVLGISLTANATSPRLPRLKETLDLLNSPGKISIRCPWVVEMAVNRSTLKVKMQNASRSKLIPPGTSTCKLFKRPDARTYSLLARTEEKECGVIVRRGRRMTSDGKALIEIQDYRGKTCGPNPEADVIVVETKPNGEENTLYLAE